MKETRSLQKLQETETSKNQAKWTNKQNIKEGKLTFAVVIVDEMEIK